MPPQNPQPFQKVPPDHLLPAPRSNAFLLITTFLLIISGAVANLYFLSPQPELIEESIPVIKDETADWKTYRNEELGFEMKIPNGFVVNDLDGVLVINKKEETAIEILANQNSEYRGDLLFFIDFNKNKISLESFYKNFGEGYLYNDLVASTTEYKYSSVNSFKFPTILGEIIVLDGKTHFVRVENGDIELSILDKILSTFKFISTSTLENVKIN